MKTDIDRAHIGALGPGTTLNTGYRDKPVILWQIDM